ncbi:hypothetical protein SAAL107622_12340 [Lacicoccus alkaliphilus]
MKGPAAPDAMTASSTIFENGFNKLYLWNVDIL